MGIVKVYETFDELLDFAESMFHDDPFFTRGNEHISFRHFACIVRGIAEKLEANQTYALSFYDPIKFACAYYACVLSGAVAFLSPRRELDGSTSGYLPLCDGDISLNEHSISASRRRLNPNCKCTIAFSAGTTAESKGVALSQKNLLTDTAYSINRYHYWRHERLLHVLPYHHLFGLVADLLAPLHAGAEVHFPLHPLQAIREVFTSKPDAINLPPAIIESLLSIEEFQNVSVANGKSLKKILCSGAALSGQSFNKLMQLGITPCTAYGMTECSPCITITEDCEVYPGTVGRELECIDLRFSSDNEILVSGDTVMMGYDENESATQQRIKDGWLYTGDLGYRDDHGHVVLTGRKDNMMVLPNGCNCSPELVEKELSVISGIQECLLIQADECIYLVIIKQNEVTLDTQGIRSVMTAHNIDRYKIVFQDHAFLRNQLGKVIRKNVL